MPAIRFSGQQGRTNSSSADVLIQTDEDYTIQTDVDYVEAIADCVITLPPHPFPGEVHRVGAQNGATAAVVGGANPLVGDPVIVVDDSERCFIFTTKKRWIEECGGMGGEDVFPTDLFVNANSPPGSDTNPGTETAPIQTLAEASRRIGIFRGWIKTPITIHLQSDIPNTDPLDIAALFASSGDGQVRVVSEGFNTLATGTFTGVTTQDPAAASGGQPWEVQDTLLASFAPFRGRRIRVTATSLDATVLADSDVALTGLQTIDGHTLVNGETVLVANNTNPVENGLWVAHAGAWTRPAGYPTGGNFNRTFLFILQGTAWAGAGVVIESFGGPDVIDTDPAFPVFDIGARKGLINSGPISWVDLDLGANDAETLDWKVNGPDPFPLPAAPKVGDTYVIEAAFGFSAGNLQFLTGTFSRAGGFDGTRLVFDNTLVNRLAGNSTLVVQDVGAFIGINTEFRTGAIFCGNEDANLFNCCFSRSLTNQSSSVFSINGARLAFFGGGTIRGDLESGREGHITLSENAQASQSFVSNFNGGEFIFQGPDFTGEVPFASRNTANIGPFVEGISISKGKCSVTGKLWGGNNGDFGFAVGRYPDTHVDWDTDEAPNIVGASGDFTLFLFDGGGVSVARAWDEDNGVYTEAGGVATRATTWANFVALIGGGGFSKKPINVGREISIVGEPSP